MATHTTQKLFIDEETQSYFYYESTNAIMHTLNNTILFGFIEGIKGPPSAPRKLIIKPITFHNNAIEFYPQGTISSGTLYMTDKNKHHMQAITCGVSHVSCIRRYIVTGNKWLLCR